MIGTVYHSAYHSTVRLLPQIFLGLIRIYSYLCWNYFEYAYVLLIFVMHML